MKGQAKVVSILSELELPSLSLSSPPSSVSHLFSFDLSRIFCSSHRSSSRHRRRSRCQHPRCTSYTRFLLRARAQHRRFSPARAPPSLSPDSTFLRPYLAHLCSRSPSQAESPWNSFIGGACCGAIVGQIGSSRLFPPPARFAFVPSLTLLSSFTGKSRGQHFSITLMIATFCYANEYFPWVSTQPSLSYSSRRREKFAR